MAERSLADLEGYLSDVPPDSGVSLADIGIARTPRHASDLLLQYPQAFGEMKSYTPSPSERLGDLIQSGLMALGADTSRARHLGQGIRDTVSFSPLGHRLAHGTAGPEFRAFD
jgi:hypothetical protein